MARRSRGQGAIRSGARRRRSGCFRWHLGRLAFSERRRIAHLSTITTDANRQLAAIQERMLVILEMTDWPLWLGEIEGDVPALLRPLPEGVLRMWPIDKRVRVRFGMTGRICSNLYQSQSWRWSPLLNQTCSEAAACSWPNASGCAGFPCGSSCRGSSGSYALRKT